jgi:hypothetical protein
MHIAARASHDACERLDFGQGEDDVFWLQPRELAAAEGKPKRRLRPPLRLAASISAGIALNLSVTGIASAPSANALNATVEVLRQPFRAWEILEAAFPVPASRPASGLAALEARVVIDGEPAAPDADVECDESEIAERHRDDMRRLLAEGRRNPNEPIEFAGTRIPRRLVDAILRASEVTGVDPVYMMALADKESSFSEDVKAATSSAEGLFQFINRTWLEVIREFGPRHGFQAEAAAIDVADGEPKIVDDPMRERVLALRRDPYVSAVMAAELLKKDRASIEQRIGRELRQTEFYLTHFFGLEAASRFMKLLDGKPKLSARRVFPQAAKANRPLFFARHGKKVKDLTVAEVYAKIDRMIDARIDRYRTVTKLNAADIADDRI